MDVHGLNPRQNKKLSDFPVYNKFSNMDFRERWEELDREENKETKEQYHQEWDEFENSNPGVYFRNNCWGWRPLWNYCYAIADDIISEELFESGHSNSGAGLNDKDAKLLGKRLLQQIREGRTIKYQASYEQYLNDLPDNVCSRCNGNNKGHNKMKDCKLCNGTGKSTNFNKHYPFDVDNVKEFAKFCIESGGFEIC